jgi:hypothetical protein
MTLPSKCAPTVTMPPRLSRYRTGLPKPLDPATASGGILVFEMPQLARGIAQALELQKKLNGIMPQPTPGVQKWRHTFGTDWSGDSAIFFG